MSLPKILQTKEISMTTNRLFYAFLAASMLLSGMTLASAQGITPPAVGTQAPAVTPKNTAPGTVREIDWDELLPSDARARFAAAPPAVVHDYISEGGMAAQQVMDFSINKTLEGSNIKIPGFVVPLDVGKDGLVTEFFLVPYFGACIHVPPPPPNQIVYVRMAKGVALDSIYEAYWITGRMKTTNKTTRLGAAAYQLDANKVEIYKY